MRRRARSDVRHASRSTLTHFSLQRRQVLQWATLPAAFFVLRDAHAAYARIASARIWPAQEYTRLILESGAPIEHQLVLLRDPNRAVLDLARIDASLELAALPARVQASDPYIAAIRIGTQGGGFLRVVLDLLRKVVQQCVDDVLSFALADDDEPGLRDRGDDAPPGCGEAVDVLVGLQHPDEDDDRSVGNRSHRLRKERGEIAVGREGCRCRFPADCLDQPRRERGEAAGRVRAAQGVDADAVGHG